MYRTGSLALLFFFSGFACLVDEVLFSRLLTFSFGVSIFSTSAVTAAFLTGLGLGAFLFSTASSRTKRPTLIYGVLELVVGVMIPIFPMLFKGLTPFLAGLFSDLAPDSFSFALFRFAAAFGLLAAPAILMGATLPFLIRAAVSDEGEKGAIGVGFFYAINTFGAAMGALLAGYVLMPALGYGGTILLASGISIAVGLIAIAMGLKESIPLGKADAKDPQQVVLSFPDKDWRQPHPLERRLAFVAVFFSGLITLSNEMIWTRILINLFGGSVYAFSLVLAMFLSGLALGAWILPGVMGKHKRPLSALGFLFALSAMSVAIGVLTIRSRLGLSSTLGAANNLHPAPGSSFFGTYLQYAALAGAAIMPQALFAGGVLPLSAGLFSLRGRLSRFTGRLYAASSLGCILGALGSGFVLLPIFSAEGGLMLGAVLSLFLAILFYLAPHQRELLNRKYAAWACGGAVVLLLMSGFWRPEDTSRIETAFFKEGPAATVKVESFQMNSQTIRSLRVNGKVVATTGLLDQRLQYLLGYLSVLCHPDPESILSVGLGTGMSSSALNAHKPKLFQIVELSKTVKEGAKKFAKYNRSICSNQAQIIPADGRNHLLLTKLSYDLVTADPIHPWVCGSGNLYTYEYFSLAASRLEEGGVMSQWIPLYQLSARNVRSILRTFHKVFPHIRVFITGYDLVVVGSLTPFKILLRDWELRIHDPIIGEDLSRIGITDLNDLLTCFLFAEKGLAAFLKDKDHELLVDANQTLEYAAPKNMWTPYDTEMITDLIRAQEDLSSLAPQDLPSGRAGIVLRKKAAYLEGVLEFFKAMSAQKKNARKNLQECIKRVEAIKD